MIHCSIKQILDIWDDLKDAKNGINEYGGDEAEIYAYRLMPYDPKTQFEREKDIDDILNASNSLVEIINLFCKKYDTASFLIEELKPMVWLKKYGGSFDHRVHVKFVPLKRKKRIA